VVRQPEHLWLAWRKIKREFQIPIRIAILQGPSDLPERNRELLARHGNNPSSHLAARRR
jgi:hypothetical protein